MKLRALLPVLALSATLGAAGCSFKEESPDASRFREPIPTKDQVTLDSGGTSSGSSTQAAPGVGTQGPSQPAYAEFYGHTFRLFQAVNYGTGWVFGATTLIVSYPPTSINDREAIWGPLSEDLSPAEWRLRVTEVATNEFEYAWEGRKKGSRDEFKPTLLGKGYARKDARHGKGTFTIDYDVANELEPARLGGDSTFGKTVVEHDITWVNNTFGPSTVRVVGVPSELPGSSFDLTLVRNGQGKGGDLRLVSHDDLDDAKNTKMEDLVLHSRWIGTGSGRADVLLSGGDVPASPGMVKISECWGSDFQRSFWTDDAGLETPVGDESVCAFTPASF